MILFEHIVKQGTKKCSQVAYVRLIRSLHTEQLEAIQDVGLGELLKMVSVTIRRDLCKWLAEAYDI